MKINKERITAATVNLGIRYYYCISSSSYYYYYQVFERSGDVLSKVFDELLSIITSQRHLYSDEDGPAFIFQCRTGKGRTTTAMAIAGLVICHLKVCCNSPQQLK